MEILLIVYEAKSSSAVFSETVQFPNKPPAALFAPAERLAELTDMFFPFVTVTGLFNTDPISPPAFPFPDEILPLTV